MLEERDLGSVATRSKGKEEGLGLRPARVQALLFFSFCCSSAKTLVRVEVLRSPQNCFPVVFVGKGMKVRALEEDLFDDLFIGPRRRKMPALLPVQETLSAGAMSGSIRGAELSLCITFNVRNRVQSEVL